jgi:RNA polymerase sigma factor (sigma-70 family)
VATDTERTIQTVFRIESPRLIAGLARMVRDVGVAEELAQDALVIALERWPESGVPDNPGAWLMATAKRRAIDHLRRNKRLERKHEELGHELETKAPKDAEKMDAALDDDIGDDLLRLVFTSCHPILSAEARVALTLRLLGGLTTDARRSGRSVRSSSRPRACRASGVGARGRLPRLQRRLLGDCGGRLDAAGAV